MARPSYESDLAEQPAALRRFAASTLPTELADLDLGGYRRIIVTAMGSSHYAGLPTWRSLVAAGLPAWWVSATELLDSPELITTDTLLVVTSQSGHSGEVVALTSTVGRRAQYVIGITDAPDSPLGRASNVCVPLVSGPEASVSSKSYLNSVAAHQRITAALLGNPTATVDTAIAEAARALEEFRPAKPVTETAESFLQGPEPRMGLIGKKDDSATVLMGALILKEASKIAAEGYVGGEFRHGPLETAGPGLTAIVLADPDASGQNDPSLAALADELIASGTDVLLIGGKAQPGTRHVPLPSADPLTRTVIATRLVQQLSVDIANGKGIIPGNFRFAQKITTAL